MMDWKYCAIPALLSLCGAASGQSLEAYTVPQTSFDEDLSLAPAIAVGQSTVVIAGTHSLRLYDKLEPVGPPATSPDFLLDFENWAPSHPATLFPFQPRFVPLATNAMSLVFPRAEYDPISGRTWMMFSEIGGLKTNLDEPSGGNICAPYLHLAVNNDDTAAFTSFSDTEWYYYTGNSSTPGNGGQAFDLDGSLQLYDVGHDTLEGNAMVPTLGFDGRAIFVTATDNFSCRVEDVAGGNPAIVMIPRTHDGGTKSILDGDRPDESDLLIARLLALPEIDNANTILTVQEPYEQYHNMTLFVSTDGKTAAGILMDGIRLRGIYNEEPNLAQAAGDWLIRQSLKLNASGTDVVLADMDVRNDWPHLKVSPPQQQEPADFPDAPGSFSPNVDSDDFMSAVLTEDNQGNPRVFATHASLDGTGEGSGWVVQWYIIDPKIDDFFTLSPTQDTGWNPEIVHAGRIETDGATQPVDGDCYLPVLGVTRSGQVYVEYTFSNPTTFPKVLRAVLDNSYTDVASTTVVKNGPSSAYGVTPDLWGLYGDMQTDPTGCAFWSTHTLVDNSTSRAAWLFRTPFFCFTTNLNADEGTDMEDMAIYNDLFLRGHRRADTDADDMVDVTDMATFIDAYDKATGP